MRPVAFDLETSLIRAACLAPRFACMTWAERGQPPRICDRGDAEAIFRAWLSCTDIVFVGHNISFDMAVMCQEFPSLMPLIFAAYDADRVTDTMIRQRLIDTACGELNGRFVGGKVYVPHDYTLETTAWRKAGIRLKKDGWRLSYGSFVDVPLSEWPARAIEVQRAAAAELATLPVLEDLTPRQIDALPDGVEDRIKGLRGMLEEPADRVVTYPLDDAAATLDVFEAQEKHAVWLGDQFRQTRAYFALHLATAHGIPTDAEGVEKLRAETQAEYEELEAELIEAGLIRTDKKRSRDTKLAKRLMVEACKRAGIDLRRTDGHSKRNKDGTTKEPSESKCKDAQGNTLPVGDDACIEHIQLSEEACEASDDELLMSYAEIGTCKKVLSNDIKAMSRGTMYPLHPSYGWAATGRTTCRNGGSAAPGTNIQNVTKRPGIRECFVARRGRLFAACDFPSLELYTLAQCCVSWLGTSALAQALIQGLDPHTLMASVMLGISYEEAIAAVQRCDAGTGSAADEEVADMRQMAKVANFGFPGGMGPSKRSRYTRRRAVECAPCCPVTPATRGRFPGSLVGPLVPPI